MNVNVNYSGAQAATPSDTTPVTCNVVYIGGAGNLTVSIGGVVVAFMGVTAGSVLPLALVGGLIMATGTTATNLMLLF